MIERPQFKVDRVASDGALCVRLSGSINETFDARSIGALGPIVVFDLAGISSITSPGVRAWCRYMDTIGEDCQLYYLRCSPCFVDQLSLVLNFGGRAQIISLQSIAGCPKCDVDVTVEYDLLREGPRLRAGKQPSRTCPKCGTTLELEETDYRFTTRYAARSIEPAAVTFLERHGLYRAPVREARPLEVTKLVEAQVTLLRFDGTFDSNLRWRRLAADVEGDVVLILTNVEFPADGIARWDELYVDLLRRSRHLILVDLPLRLADLNERGHVDLSSAIVDSVRMPVYCSGCGDARTQSVSLAQLKDTDAITVVCERCGGETQNIPGEYPLGRLQKKYRPTPSAASSVIARISGLFSAATVEARITSERAPKRSEPGGKETIGGYRIIRPLSEGGMAEIFLATREAMGGFEKPVALKRFRRQLLETSRTTLDMFLKEARVSANLNHPNIVQTIDVGEEGGDLYIVMEYIEGRDLRSILLQHGKPLPPEFVTHVGLQIAAALDYAHNARDINGQPINLVHRDVSLQNILIGYDGRIKLIDFGIALAGQRSQSSVVAGNLCYMSPEQCKNEKLDGRSDLFSLGVVLYELLRGNGLLFYRSTVLTTLQAVLEGPIPPLDGVPPALEQVVRGALERDRKKRFQSAGAIVQALRHVATDIGTPPRPDEIGAFVRGIFPVVGPTSAPESPYSNTLPGAPVASTAPFGALPAADEEEPIAPTAAAGAEPAPRDEEAPPAAALAAAPVESTARTTALPPTRARRPPSTLAIFGPWILAAALLTTALLLWLIAR